MFIRWLTNVHRMHESISPSALYMLLVRYYSRSERLKNREITDENEKRWVDQEVHDLITRKESPGSQDSVVKKLRMPGCITL